MTEQSATAHTYAKLFPEQLVNPCSPDAPESNTGPIAYLHALYQKAMELESASKDSKRLTLATRRPDIGELLLDPCTLEQPVSALALAIHTLTQHAKGCAGATAYLPEVLANAGQHAHLPFNYALEQAKAVLAYKKIPLFELLQQTQYSYPNFCYEGFRSDDLRQVMRNASGFSPALQALLLEEKPLRQTGDDWRKWYGMADIDAKKAIASLLDVETFSRRTGLSFEQILELLAVTGIDDDAAASYSLVRSSNAYRPTGKPKLDEFHYGAAYINARRKTPLTIKDALAGAGIKPQFDSLDYNALSRMYQMIHLQRALALPFNDVDLLLTSILRAEEQFGNWHLSPATLRAFGVFRYLNEAYGISAEQFAALVCEVNPFAVGEQVPMLDRVLDGPGAVQLDPLNPLILDDRAFDPADGADGQFKVMPALARALGVDEQATLVYLAQVKRALGLKTHTVSLSLLSSLYRLSRLHRLFQRSASEASALVALLATTGTDVLAQLAGTPLIRDGIGSDVLDTLVALSNLDQWLRLHQILPSVLLEALRPVPTTDVALGSTLLDTLKGQKALIEDMRRPEATDSQQRDFVANLLLSVFGNQRAQPGLSLQHVPPLLGWSDTTAKEVLETAITLIDKAEAEALAKTKTKTKTETETEAKAKAKAEADKRSAATRLWFKLERRCALVTLLRLSPGVLRALSDKPEWFDLEKTSAEAPNLDLCYQLSRFRDWVEVCRANGADEHDAIDYLTRHPTATPEMGPIQVAQAASALSALLGWSASEVEAACPSVLDTGTVEDSKPTFDDFLKTLTAQELSYYETEGITNVIRWFVVRVTGYNTYDNKVLQAFVDKLSEFLNQNPGPLLVTQEQYNKAYKPKAWEKRWETINKTDTTFGYFPITMKIVGDRPGTVSRQLGTPCVPSTISDIDHVLRLKRLSEKTGLACNSLRSISELNEGSPYREFEGASQLLMASADDELRDVVDKQMREHWRDALAGYLIAQWAPSKPDEQASVACFDDLSSYCLSDIRVSSEVTTTRLNQAIGSLQHYLSRLYARLEPGYGNTGPSGLAQAEWQKGLGQYGTWKRTQEQSNHPANLIYYANRPNKSVAFQELEVEINQGKMDTALIHTAVCNYLTKFERTSNLQVISGYLDGNDPSKDTFHLIGKTNTSPPEYFWRTLDMSLRDDKERLNPLAWGEWEKIGLSATGSIPQSSCEVDSKTITCDAIRPVIIEGRRYVFWVERGATDLPSGVTSGKTLPKVRKLSVHYAFQQSDGTWSTPNELMCLDGHDANGKWGGDEVKSNPYLKDDSYTPGLIVVVSKAGVLGSTPWLVAMMYDCKYAPKEDEDPQKNGNCFIEMRDLLLIDKNESDKTETLCKKLLNTYKNIKTVQQKYNQHTEILLIKTKFEESDSGSEYISSEFHDYFDKENCFVFNASISSESKKTIKIYCRYKNHVLSSVHTRPMKLYIKVKTPDSKDFSALDEKACNADKTHEFETFYTFKELGEYQFFVCFRAGNYDINWGTLTYVVENDGKHGEKRGVQIERSPTQVQYLDLSLALNVPAQINKSQLRLNTLFGKQLVGRATQSVECVLGWETQCLTEPGIDSNHPNPMLDFHGSNGIYFRELFLHLPALVAMRLTEQQQFEEAEDWYLRYLFNPYRAETSETGPSGPWCTRLLSEVGTLSSTLQKDVDPINRVFVLSRHYRQAVYLALVENWQSQGDHFYRQLTLSTLNQAWLCYQQALQLLGPLPEGSNASRWKAVTLASFDGDGFRRPLNARVLTLHQTLQSRLYNLRHGLTLDGKQLPALDWNSESLDAFDTGRGGVSNLPIPYRSGQVDIPHYRFRQLLPLAKAAAQQLSDFGRHYMSLMEEEFNTSLSVQLKAQDIKMADFAIRIQKEAISGIKAKKKVLQLSRDKAAAQKDYLSQLIDNGRSPEEESATAFKWIANTSMLLTIPFELAAGLTEAAVPTVYGMAFGGNQPGAGFARRAQAFHAISDFSAMISDELLVQAAYNRRATEWDFDKTQAEWDMKILDQQINETDIELNASTIALAQSQQDLVNLKEAYVSMTTGFTIIPVYNWLVARQEHIYGAAYDAVRSLCMGVEAAWRYEIGDYRRDSFIDTSAWRDNYKGMLVGESLLVNLQQMENEYLARNERRLTIKKSFSLKKLLDSDAAKAEEKWAGIFKADTNRTTPLTHSFEFKADNFDKSYPGQYLRQLKYVSVTLVFKADKKAEELCALLKQTGSSTLLEPDKDAARSFYPGKESDKKVKAARENPRLVLRNPRENQQIALSSTVAEDGLGYDAGTWVYELMFHDGRYLPFEGTGTISQWTLELLGDEDLLKDPSIIEDIRFNMVYTAKAGDAEFVKEIGEIRKEAATAKKKDA